MGVIIYLAIIWRHSNELLLGPLPSSAARELSIEEVERTLGEFVVPIGNQPRNWAGSAVAVQPRRLISVCHVGKDHMVTLVQGQLMCLRLLAEHPASDQCLFKADHPLPRVVPGHSCRLESDFARNGSTCLGTRRGSQQALSAYSPMSQLTTAGHSPSRANPESARDTWVSTTRRHDPTGSQRLVFGSIREQRATG